jgi:integrase
VPHDHVIPRLGAHRLDRLRPEHLKKLYKSLQDPNNKALKPATVHLVHRTVRVALNEAVRRGHIVENPALVAKPPRLRKRKSFRLPLRNPGEFSTRLSMCVTVCGSLLL